VQPESTKTAVAPAIGAAKLCHFGLPMWSNRSWSNSLFPKSMGSGEALHYYSQVFDSVEGNTTFYALPSAASVSSWRAQVSANFQFCFKLPRTVTHDNQLRYCGVQLSEYFNRLEPLAAHCGTFMIQLPESFEPRQLGDLAKFIGELPADYHFAVEVRHSDFFNRGTEEQALNELLRSSGVDRVCFDSRALFSQGAITDEEIDAQKKKPKLPVHAIATATKPILRFIGCSDVEHNKTYFMPWVKKITQWRETGIVPTVFIHTPDNRAAPEQAVILQQMLNAVPGWQPLAKELRNSGDATQMSFF
jgi:uncharacterized protein YecE (DUF72 family)